MRGTASLVALSSLSLLLPPPLPRYPTVVAALPIALATTVTNLATAIAAISSCCHRIALSCCISLAIILAAVVAALSLLLPLLLPPRCPHPGPCCCCLRCHFFLRNPRPCCHQRRNTPLLPPRCPCTSHPHCHPCCRHIDIAPTLADAAIEADLLVDCYVPTAADSVVACCSLLLSLMLIVGCSSSSS